MKKLTKLSAIALAGSVMMTPAQAIEIEVGYRSEEHTSELQSR